MRTRIALSGTRRTEAAWHWVHHQQCSDLHAPIQLGGRRRERGEQGLTTLSWLLITAAVAAMAALAVVLVQAQVEDTAGRVSNPDPRVTSAVHTAFIVENDAKAAAADDFDTWADWEQRFTRECGLIAVLYGDAGVTVAHNRFHRATSGSTAFDAAAANHAAAADERAPTPTKAQVQCGVQ